MRISSLVPRAEARPRGCERRAQQEVSREVHARHAKAGASGNLEIHDREADRNAGTAIQHFVQKLLRGSSYRSRLPLNPCSS